MTSQNGKHFKLSVAQGISKLPRDLSGTGAHFDGRFRQKSGTGLVSCRSSDGTEQALDSTKLRCDLALELIK